MIRRLYPNAKAFARARDRRHAWVLMDLGAQSIRELFHSSLQMAQEVLVELGLPATVASDHAQRFSEHDQRLLNAQYLVQDDEDALMQSAQDARSELEELFNADAGGGVLGAMVTPDAAVKPP